jgi:hypothetical protein
MTVTGSLIVSGSGTFTNIGPAVFSGSLTSTAGFTGSFSGTATSASFAANAASASWVTGSNVVGTVASTTSASFATQAQTASFANTFTVNSTLTAQTLVVQTITSSVVYSSGSNIFGNNIANTQMFTGSLLVSGSIGIGMTPSFPLDITSTSTGLLGRFTSNQNEAQIRLTNTSAGGRSYSIGSGGNSSAGAKGFYIYDETSSATVFAISGSGQVGIGTSTPSASLHISLNSNTGSSVSHLFLFNPTSGTSQTAGIRLGTSSEWRVQLRTVENQDWLQIADNGGTVRHGWYGERYYPGASSLNNSGTGYISGNGTGIGIGTATIAEGTQSASSISIFPSSSVSSGPLIQFSGNGRIRPASTGDRLSIDGNALYLNSYIGGNIITNTAGGGVGIGASPVNSLSVRGNADFGSTGIAYAGMSQYGALTFPRGQIMWSNTNSQNQLYIVTNAYSNNNGVFAYRNSSQPAAAIGLDSGGMSFLVAGNGTADAAISWTSALGISNAGYITTPSQPAFYAYGPGAGSTSTTGNYIFSGTRLNRGSHYNTGNGRFTAPVAGVYRFVFASLYRQKSGTGSGEISISINGSNINSRGIAYALATNSTDTHVPMTAELIYSLNAGDYVMPFIYSCGAGSDFYMDSNLSYFCGHLLG